MFYPLCKESDGVTLSGDSWMASTGIREPSPEGYEIPRSRTAPLWWRECGSHSGTPYGLSICLKDYYLIDRETQGLYHTHTTSRLLSYVGQLPSQVLSRTSICIHVFKNNYISTGFESSQVKLARSTELELKYSTYSSSKYHFVLIDYFASEMSCLRG